MRVADVRFLPEHNPFDSRMKILWPLQKIRDVVVILYRSRSLRPSFFFFLFFSKFSPVLFLFFVQVFNGSVRFPILPKTVSHCYWCSIYRSSKRKSYGQLLTLIETKNFFLFHPQLIRY